MNGDVEKSPSVDTPYFSAVVRRAVMIYREAFAKSQYGFLVAVQGRSVEVPPLRKVPQYRRWREPPTLFEFAKDQQLGLSRPSGKAIITAERKERYELMWAEIAPMSIDYGLIFEAIANQDFWVRRPRISGDVYIVDPEEHLILHMYDDRGMDVIAKASASLQPLYSRLNNWILEYDRKRIDETFHDT